MSTTSITASGTGSGNDFESIISASVSAKETKLAKRATKQKNLAQIELDGVNSLKTALKTFQTACETLTEDNSMNTHKVTTSQKSTDNIFTVTADSDAVNTNFDLTVTQLAKSEAITKKTKMSEDENSFAAGKITIDLGQETYEEDGVEKTRDRTFTIDVEDGDSLELIRKKLNQNDYGVSMNLVKTTDGYAVTIDSGTTGTGGDNSTNLKITTSTTGSTDSNQSLDFFNYDVDDEKDGDVNDGWTYRAAKNALILVDGNEVSSTSNTFSDQISGLTITVNSLSDTETLADGTTGYKSYNVDVSSNVDAAYNKMSSFVDAFNTLMSSMDTLYAHNTYTDGENNYDGGDLSGDSQLKSIQNMLQNMVVRYTGSSSGKTIFDCGLSYESDGTLSIDSTTFKEALNNSFASVTSLFTDEDGLIEQLQDYVKDYTKTAGVLDDRIDDLNSTISGWEEQERENEEYLEKYEESLRTKYGNLDSLMSSYNTSLSYITSLLS